MLPPVPPVPVPPVPATGCEPPVELVPPVAPAAVEPPVELVPPVPSPGVSFEPQARKSDVRTADPRKRWVVRLWFMESFFYVTDRRKSRRASSPATRKNIRKTSSVYSVTRQFNVSPGRELKSS